MTSRVQLPQVRWPGAEPEMDPYNRARLTKSVADLGHHMIDSSYKGFPPWCGPMPLRDLRKMGWNVRAGQLSSPAAILKDSAMRHNISLMAQYCSDRGVSIAPHAKTAMSPNILRRQAELGVYGFTAATLRQARLLQGFGINRVLFANQLIDPHGLRWLAEEMRVAPDFELIPFVDSTEVVDLMTASLRRQGCPRSVPVLIELGAEGSRSGCRTTATTLTVADRIRQSDQLHLIGVAGYEGAIRETEIARRLKRVDDFLAWMSQITQTLAGRGSFEDQREIIVSAGGSAFFDRVVAAFSPLQASHSAVIVLRCGSYVTHGIGYYSELSPLDGRADRGDATLLSALEVWGEVLSVPETRMAVVGVGKRDLSYDFSLPRALRAYRRDSSESVDLDADCVTTGVYDHHLIMSTDSTRLGVGDLVSFRTSHPCADFEKWRLVFVVDDDYRITDGLLTYF